jgi:trehalose 6-phosphate phosphatase
VVAAKPELPAALASAGADPGVWVEDKRLALVVHTRRTADPDGELDRLGAALERFAARYGLEPHPGKMVMELRPPGFDKGGVLRRLAEERAPAAVLFAGDDVGDLPGFAAVERLREAGTPGLTVASASAEAVEVAQAADVAVDGPAGVVELLGRLADAVGGRGGDARGGPGAGDADDGPGAGGARGGPGAGDADDGVRSRRR